MRIQRLSRGTHLLRSLSRPVSPEPLCRHRYEAGAMKIDFMNTGTLIVTTVLLMGWVEHKRCAAGSYWIMCRHAHQPQAMSPADPRLNLSSLTHLLSSCWLHSFGLQPVRHQEPGLSGRQGLVPRPGVHARGALLASTRRISPRLSAMLVREQDLRYSRA